jgi:hypothetical protein
MKVITVVRRIEERRRSQLNPSVEQRVATLLIRARS